MNKFSKMNGKVDPCQGRHIRVFIWIGFILLCRG